MEIFCSWHKKLARNDGEAVDVTLASQVHNLFHKIKLTEAKNIDTFFFPR